MAGDEVNKKFVIPLIIIFLILTIAYIFVPFKSIINEYIFNIFKPKFIVSENSSKVDNNKNGVADPLDIVNGAYSEVQNKTKYISNYHNGGYPPEKEGVCTDVIWRGFKTANINIKDLIDEDIKRNIRLYPRVDEKADPNIDFRRVPNQDVFFSRNALSLTTEVKARNAENLKEWQPGDIVVFNKGYEHIGIISDKRDKNGIPYVIHNTKPHASILKLSYFTAPVHAHYRWKFD
ncbi:DUF1287 domain-containing protein [Clostridium lacusfryxellense]|uniref:DUF1287 domain-containing protein n=1 Tax=Clostridium lacusfryxellense TaxID=205328 RepID=UPI001C0B7BC2|nr:DUF1287 domain-containing protein [Clostridium lacusfryxellense]MBU3114464.1 DUF1287 domain-containing protein [Clostridium lacusfryxellense]